jgi:DNA-binding CsgD family transcriptional regulator
VRTVHHHLHATYGRLGVPTRSAAVARVLGLDGHRPTLPTW